jgi:hypothetical protein
VEAVQAFPFPLTGESGVDFNASTALKQLGSIVDRLTYLGTCELFLEPQEVSLMRHLTNRPDTLMGSLLERQLESLHSSTWKEGVKQVVNVLLEDALDVYGRQSMPVRRAKVMVRCMEFMYHGGLKDGLATRWDVEEMGKEIDCLEASPVGPLNLIWFPANPVFVDFSVLKTPPLLNCVPSSVPQHIYGLPFTLIDELIPIRRHWCRTTRKRHVKS